MAINPGEDILASHFKGTRYYSVHPADFVKDVLSAFEPELSEIDTKSGSDTGVTRILACIHLPHGAVITGFKVFWYRNDAVASATARLKRLEMSNSTLLEMAAADSNSSAGPHSVEDTTIDYDTVNNIDYAYFVKVELDPNDSKEDVRIRGIVITYTVDSPLP